MATDSKHFISISLILHQTVPQTKCLNVLQGEVAHATPDQANWMVSVEATNGHMSYRRHAQQ
jgi:hypothetical protein